MGIRFKCHHCQAPLNIKLDLANKRGVCPHCHGKFRIPNASQELSLSLEASAPPSSISVSIPSENAASASVQNLNLKAGSEVTTSTACAETPTNGPIPTEQLYFVRPPSGGEYGPASQEIIELWISQRRITADTLVCVIGSTHWKKAREVFANYFRLDG